MSHQPVRITDKGDYDLWTKEILAFLRKNGQKISKEAEARVFLLSNSKLRELKKKFLGKDMPVVDVLSFPEPKNFPNPDEKNKLGEIFLNRDIAKQSKERAFYLLVHGILHLLGYEHERKSDTIKMSKLEEKICVHFLVNP